MFAAVAREFGRVDVLVNNAGIQKPSASEDIEMSDFDRVLGVNLRGAFLCARQAIRHFLSRPGGGVILNNSSVHEIIPKPKYLPYSISKGGMENLTKSLALEYAGQGIRVNAVGPGAVVTPINKAWIDNPKARGEVESHIPMGRAAAADEIASVFAFLASDDASYVTGQTILPAGIDALSRIPRRLVVGRIRTAAMTLENRVVLITGAKGGWGRITNAFLAAAQRSPVSRDRFNKAISITRVSRPSAELRRARPRNRGGRSRLAIRTIDTLVHLLGGFAGGTSVADSDDTTLDQMFEPTSALFHISRAVLPGMRTRHAGSLLAVGSRTALEPQAGLGLYSASKAALVSLMGTIAKENACCGVSANVVLPGTMDTPANRKAMPDADTSKWVQPSQIAALLVHLASRQATQLSGAVIPVYGGEV
jgi:NAD(P)-dependent dehydrogenase (short-subunit alcohol dehydrogenase family)